jgi:hypothetical protein
VLLFDVLQLLTIDEQDALLAELAARLDRGGVLLVREADASGGWRFAAVRFGNRFKQLVSGNWRQPFQPRTDAEWRACFARHGFHIDARPMGKAPFANIMFRLSVAPDAFASPRQPSPAV